LAGGDLSSAEKYAEKYFKGKQGLDCYLKLIEANGYIDRFNIEDNNLARRMIEEVVAMCPENPRGYNILGWTYHRDFLLGNTKSPQETLEKGMELAQKTLAMDDSPANAADAHSLLSALYQDKGEFDEAIAEGERSVALNPRGSRILVGYASVLNLAGRPEEAIPLCEKAIRLDPFGPSVLYRLLGTALRNAGRFEEAVSALKKAIQIEPNNIMAHSALAITYSLMGRENEARAEVAEVLRINPKFSVDYAVKSSRYKDQSLSDKLENALSKAGLK
jgi:adenylate cyclase